MIMIKNPFPVTGYLGPEYFCDRETELDRLTNAVVGSNYDQNTQ